MSGFALAKDPNPEIGAVDLFQWFCVWHTVEEIPHAIEQLTVDKRIKIKEASPEITRKLIPEKDGRAWLFMNFSPFMVLEATNDGWCDLMTTDVVPAIAHEQFKAKFKRRIHLGTQTIDQADENRYAMTDIDPNGKVLHLIVYVLTARPEAKEQGTILSAMHEAVLNSNGYSSPDWPQ